MAKRRTVEIEKLKRMANEYFVHSGDDYREARRAIQSFVEAILHDTDNYRGFMYLTAEQSKPGHSIGLAYDLEAHKNIFPDDSRVRML